MTDRDVVVLDASAVLELLLKGTGWRTVERLVLDGDAYAPDLLDVEVVHVLRRLWLAGRRTVDEVDASLGVLEDLPIRRVEAAGVVRGAWRHRANLSVYDACYVVVAELVDGRLVTRDAALAGVPGMRVAVEVLPR